MGADRQFPGEPNVPRLLHAHKLLREHPDLAMSEYKALAEMGSRWAMIHLGHGFERGKHWPADSKAAEYWYMQATDRGSPFGQYMLGRYYLRQKRFDEGLSAFRLGAAREYAPSLHQLGRMYYFGVGVPSDKTKAKSYLERASKKGNLTAKVLLSRLLLRDEPGLLNWIKGAMLKLDALIGVIFVVFTEGAASERFK